MPRIPNPREFDQINFITNYFLAGCTPPFMLFCEFAREPALDLGLLLLAPDLQDIGQAIFEPKKGRRRNPARHGRKRGRGIRFPDTSDMIGQRMRGFLNPGDVIRFSPLRYGFVILNVWEGINFTAAVLEGLTETFFEGLLGVITVDLENCPDLGRMVREVQNSGTIGTPAIPIDPVQMPILRVAQNFVTSNVTGQSLGGECAVALSMLVVAINPAPDRKLGAALGKLAQGVEYQGPALTFSSPAPQVLSVGGTFEDRQVFVWGVGERNGFFRVLSGRVVAYSLADIPWW